MSPEHTDPGGRADGGHRAAGHVATLAVKPDKPYLAATRLPDG